jgi:exodeoxyribonuclease I
LRPEGIEWPDHEPGRPSFKLEHLTAANGLDHKAAHDALSDVTATIAVAKLVKDKQPRLFDYVVNMRSKKAVGEMLNLSQRKPFFHISGMLSRAHMYGAIMMPLAQHPTNNNGIICIDLSFDPEVLLDLSPEEIARRVFTSTAELRDHEVRIPLKVVYINKAPVVTTHRLLDEAAAKRLNIDVPLCELHWQRLNQMDLSAKLQAVFNSQSFPEKPDAEQRLYDGFLPNGDKHLLEEVRQASCADLTEHRFHFSDPRYNDLLFSYRARYFNDSLSDREQGIWAENCRWRLTDEKSGYLTMEQQGAEIAQLLANGGLSAEQITVLEALIDWAAQVNDEFSLSS